MNKIIFLAALINVHSIFGFSDRQELNERLNYRTQINEELEIYEQTLNNFILESGEEYKLVNSAIKQDYSIFFSGRIVDFDTLIIGKGAEKYLSSFLVITQDSIFISKITHSKNTKSYRHNLSLQENLVINIDRKIDSAFITIISRKDTFKITSDFVGMNHPFIKSIGCVINVDNFEFTYKDYMSDIYVFGDSYVNCGTPQRWPYYTYKEGYSFFCDGLPGGRSRDSYDFLNSAISIHKPKYVVWCLGMNDGNDDESAPNSNWEYYIKKVMKLCNMNNITLILTTIPTVPKRDHTKKNELVRESGYRYIDFDKAVSDGIGNWKEGMLSDDGVHPTENGAKVMAERFLADLPEIKDYKKIMQLDQ